MDIKVQLAPQYNATDSLAPRATFQGYPIKFTVPGGVLPDGRRFGDHALLRMPEEYGPAEIDLIVRDWLARGLIVDDGRGIWRTEHQGYVPYGFPELLPFDVAARFTVGDTYILHGVTDEVRARGNWGAKRLGHVDTPVQPDHPFFQGKTLVRALPILPSGDHDAHGTHTLSTAAGGEGVAYDAEMYTYPALVGGSGSESSVAAGIRWCADNNCDVHTLSLGGSPSGVIDDAVYYARNRGQWVIAAAGNSGGNPIPGSPARASTIIVMACDRNFAHTSFTDGMNWSLPHRYFGQGLYIVAGVPGGTTGIMSGTSMACPHVAGLCLFLRPCFTEQQLFDYFDSHLLQVA